MSSGKTHEILGISSMILISAASSILEEPLLMVSAVGALGATICTPDIDQSAMETRELRRIRRIFGRESLSLWKAYWTPFRLLKHRSCVSHSWPWGSFARFSWFFLIPVAITVFVISESDLEQLGQAILWSFLGWSIVDWSHLIADKLYGRLVGICGR